jgi:hypothetical protein
VAGDVVWFAESVTVLPLIEWLLDLENIHLGRDAPLILKWHPPVEGWMLFCFGLLAALWIAMIYRREMRTPQGQVSWGCRAVLWALRCGIIALVAAVICRPSLVLQRNRVEPSYVVVALDTSQSMAAADRYRDDALALSIAQGAGLEDTSRLAARSRLDLLQAALVRDHAAPLRALLARNGIQFCTFAGEVQTRGFFPSGIASRARRDATRAPQALIEAVMSAAPTGATTDLAGAIRHLVEKTHGRRLAAIVLASDGQSTALPLPTIQRDSTSQPTALTDAVDLARDRQIPIFPLRIGSTHRPWDISVGAVRTQPSVFVNDLLVVEVQVVAQGLTKPMSVTVRLLDKVKSQKVEGQRSTASDLRPSTLFSVLSSKRVVLDPYADPPNPRRQSETQSSGSGAGFSVAVELTTKPTQTGRVRYRVEVLPDPNAHPEGDADPEGDELTTLNNVQLVDINVLDTRFSVLYVEGYPRYEYRYLKNALLRESRTPHQFRVLGAGGEEAPHPEIGAGQTMELSVLLIEADEHFVQEGTDPIRRFPTTPEELNRYDVVLFGDVDPQGGWLTTAQMNMLLDFVGNEGGGFGLIAGERAAPRRFLGTPLEKLIPVRIDPLQAGPPAFPGVYDTTLTAQAGLLAGFHVRLTADGRQSRIFRFAEDRAESQRLFDELPRLYWFTRTLGPKPGASVLGEHPTVRVESRKSKGPKSDFRPLMPIFVTGRYGAGKLFFQATDDTWRWRRHRGEVLHDSYWVQVARELMPTARVAHDRRFVVRTDRRVYPFGLTVKTQVEVFDSQLLADQGDTVQILVTAGGGASGAHPTVGGRLSFSNRDPTSEKVGHPPDSRVVAASRVIARFDVYRISPESNLFEATWIPSGPGSYLISAADIAPRPGQTVPSSGSVLIRIDPPDLEARHPQADHETLERIAAATGGRVLELDELEAGFRTIRDRSVQIPDDVEEPLWDSKLVLMLFVTMISMEWVLRKAFGLL